MLRPGFGAGDFLAAVIVVIGLTILFVLTESQLVVAFDYSCKEWRCRKVASEFAQKGDAKGSAEAQLQADVWGQYANRSLKIGLVFVPLVAIGAALSCVQPLRSLMRRMGLIRSSKPAATVKPPNRPLRTYLRLLAVSAILATIIYTIMFIGVTVSVD
jgi:hypothetical protein